MASDTFAKLARRLDALTAELHVPGASFAVWHEGQLFEHATGVINRRTGVTATPDAIFQIGSITKLLTSTLVMQLIEEGVIALDDTVAEHIANFSVADIDTTRTVTVAQMLSHTSGIDGDFFENTGTGDDKVDRFVIACRALPTLHPAGELFSYCNVGFNLLGRIVEIKRGGTWEWAIKRWLFNRLGPTSFVRFADETLRYRAAIGHTPPTATAAADVVPVPYLAKSAAPAGSVLYAAARDLVTFGRSVLGNGVSPSEVTVLRGETLAAMLSPRIQLPPHSMCSAFGLGFMLFDWDSRRVIGHDGSTMGQQAFLRIVPDRSAIVVLLTNGGFASELYHRLFPEAFSELFGIQIPPRPSPRARELVAADWTGHYHKFSQNIHILEDGGELTATVHGARYTIPEQKFVLEPVDDRLCIGTYPGTPTPATFHRVADTKGCDYVMFGGRVHRRTG